MESVKKGDRVRVYWNLHKHCYSVQKKRDDGQWVVAAHMEELYLRGVTFKVSDAGRERVRQQERKNVHAMIEGTLTKTPPMWPRDVTGRVSYNPYKDNTFVRVDSDGGRHPIRSCVEMRLEKSDGRPVLFAVKGYMGI